MSDTSRLGRNFIDHPQLRWLLAALAAVMLTGCPAATRLYIQNEATAPLVFKGWGKSGKTTIIGPGRTAWIPVRNGEDDCIEFDVDGRKLGYIVDINAHAAGRGTGYGWRIDAVFESDRLKVRGESAELLELETSIDCTD